MVTTQSSQEYIPGVCNIGPDERAKRLLVGYGGTIATVLILIFLIVINAPAPWRLVMAIPISIAAMGFLQNRLHFCVGFGLKGIFNVINSAGITDNVELEAFRKLDRRKALYILIQSGLTGIVVATIFAFV